VRTVFAFPGGLFVLRRSESEALGVRERHFLDHNVVYLRKRCSGWMHDKDIELIQEIASMMNDQLDNAEDPSKSTQSDAQGSKKTARSKHRCRFHPSSPAPACISRCNKIICHNHHGGDFRGRFVRFKDELYCFGKFIDCIICFQQTCCSVLISHAGGSDQNINR